MPAVIWDIRRAGRAWQGEEGVEKIEMVRGRLFWSDEDRLTMLGLLLENVGIDAAVRLGDAREWKAAVANLP
jgi:hypothetical protein